MKKQCRTGVETTVPLGVKFDDSGICILESLHSRGFHMNWTCQNYWKLLVVFAGGGELELADGRLAVQEDSLVLIPPLVRHRLMDSIREPLSVYIVCIAESRLVTDLEQPTSLAGILWTRSRETAQLVRENIRRIRFEEERRLAGSIPMRHALITQVLVRLIRESGGIPEEPGPRLSSRDRIQEYLAGLDSSFFLPDSIDSVAQRMGISRRRFTQLVREQCGCSWSELVRGKRIRYALQLLKNPGRSVTAIAFECGFEDLSTFYRAFRREVGMKPEQCRGKLPPLKKS